MSDPDLSRRLSELMDELERTDQRRADIRGQIERAQAHRTATGEYADADWYRRATAALRYLGIERNDITREIGEVNRSIRKANAQANQQHFAKAVRETVDDTTWALIVERHRELEATA